jgi:hypothetical protein
MKKKISLVISVICLLVLMFTLISCSKEETPKQQEGVIYQSEVKAFWVGIGRAYVTFEHTTAPSEIEEGKLYGDIFSVIVSADSGKTYSTWLTGTWKIDGDVLTINATWEEGDKSTMLANATSGEDKTYQKEDGKFVIGVKLPSAGTINFEIEV